MKWTDTQVEVLSRLWMEGLTATQIAAAMGKGMTRNAVIGKVHRLGLSGFDRIVEDVPPTALGDEPTAPDKTAVAGVRRKMNAKMSGVTIAELSNGMCRWPADEPSFGQFRYCGQTTAKSGPYCARHGKLAYQPARPIAPKAERNALFPSVIIAAAKS